MAGHRSRITQVHGEEILRPIVNAYLDAFLEAKIDLVPWGFPCERIEGGMFTGRNSAQDTCEAGVCTGANPVVCTASDQCHVAGTCNPSSGTCSNPDKANGSAMALGRTRRVSSVAMTA